MSAGAGNAPGVGQLGAGRVARHAVPLAVLWAILGSSEGWGFGIPVVLLASIASCLLLPPMRLSLGRLVAFAPYFAWSSVRAGFQVAWLAVHPRMPIDPAVLRHELQLDDVVARVTLANVVTLLPGTLSADLQDRVLVVHVLDAGGSHSESLRRLEQRVADLFGERKGSEAK